MPTLVVPILWGILAYSLGSMNWGPLVARRYGVDILTVGNRNPGAANVFRVVGPLPGIAVYLGDMLIATLAVVPTRWLPLSDVCMPVASVMVVVGTMFPIFSRFRGGTGLAKGTGVAMGINPLGFLLALPLGLLVLGRLRDAGWAGGLVFGVVLLISAFVSGDVVGAGSIAGVGALVFLRSRLQYRNQITRVGGPG